MTSIIPGVSSLVESAYLAAYNNENTLMFSVVYMLGLNTNRKQFSSCQEAVDYANWLVKKENYNPDKISILLNKPYEPLLVTDDDLISICAFEADEQFYTVFQMYAEKMSRAGRVAKQDLQQQEDEAEDEEELELLYKKKWEEFNRKEDEETQEDSDSDFGFKAQRPSKNTLVDCKKQKSINIYDDHLDYLKMRVFQQDTQIENLFREIRVKDLRIVSLEEDLDNTNKKIKDLTKETRDAAMNHILSMGLLEFQERLLYGKDPVFKLPQFKRAIEGDKDYSEERPFCHPVYGSAYPKRRLTSSEIDTNRCNFGDYNRKFLRYMSEEEFKKMCYDDYNP
jgi:hypothetical protein